MKVNKIGIIMGIFCGYVRFLNSNIQNDSQLYDIIMLCGNKEYHIPLSGRLMSEYNSA